MKNNIICAAIFAYCVLPHGNKAIGQSNTELNAVFIELGGNSLFTSLNYERQLLKSTRLQARIGIGMYGITPTYVTVPIGLSYLFKLNRSNSFVELGFGATYSKADVVLYTSIKRKDPNYINTDYWNYVPGIAFRRITKRNLMYRFSLAPVINSNGLLPFVGFSIGKSF